MNSCSACFGMGTRAKNLARSLDMLVKNIIQEGTVTSELRKQTAGTHTDHKKCWQDKYKWECGKRSRKLKKLNI